MTSKAFFARLIRLTLGLALVAGLLALTPQTAQTASPNGVDGPVTAVAMTGDRIYAGGLFNNAGGQPAANIAYHEGAVWLPMGAGVNGQVYAIALDSLGRVYVGGEFTTAGGASANYIARWDPSTSTWSALGSGLNGRVMSLAVDASNNVYVGGNFTASGNGNILLKRLAKYNATTGAWSEVKSGANGLVRTMLLSGSKLWVGGNFTKVGSKDANHVAWYDIAADSWNLLSQGYYNGVNGNVNALAFDASGNLFVGGDFSAAGPATAKNIAVYYPSIPAWGNLGKGANDVVRGLAYKAGVMYVGGFFTQLGNVAASHIGQWTPAGGWAPLGAGMNGNVFALVADDLVAGGQFTTAGGTAANNISVWDGTSWTPLLNNPTPVVLADLSATPGAQGVTVAWETLQESNVMGFNILRAAGDGNYQRINPDLILTKAPGSQMGAVYSYLDATVQSGLTYTYQLEVVNTDGTKEVYGPVTAVVP